MKARISAEARQTRLQKMLAIRDEFLKDIDNTHLHLMKGNSKTGKDCWTVSLIPIVDCYNCKECMVDCYDINTDCRFPAVLEDRARNSAIHMHDRKRYFDEISEQIKVNKVRELRINVGGDLEYLDFFEVARIAKDNTECEFLFFTKSYDDINRFLSESAFPSNVHPIISRWLNVECENKFNLPESHVLYDNGKTTAPMFGAKYCQGNCSNCFAGKDEGCPTLKCGESVIFRAH